MLSNLTRIAGQKVTAPRRPSLLTLFLLFCPEGVANRSSVTQWSPVEPFSSDAPSSARPRSRPFPFQQDSRRGLEVQSQQPGSKSEGTATSPIPGP